MNDISKKIFEGEPKNPQSIQIEYSDADDDDKLFIMLLEIFYDGMRKFHGVNNKVCLELVKDEDLFQMRQYYWSFGFDIFYKVYDLDKNLIKNYDKNTKRCKTSLKDLFMNLKTSYLIYEISFDYYDNYFAK